MMSVHSDIFMVIQLQMSWLEYCLGTINGIYFAEMNRKFMMS
jgi:hypothetical protein